MPELEAWQSVIITGTNGDLFLDSVHGPQYSGDLHHALSCQHCHGGPADNTFETVEEAHVGVILDPSATGESGCTVCHDGSDAVGDLRSACDGCHTSEVTFTANSLHTTQGGYITAIEQRGGEYTEAMEPYFEARCGACHTTCGQCHVTRPNSVGGGFMLKGGTSLSSHRFYGTPDMTEQCTACHGTRVGDDFQGKLEGVTADVHYNRGMRCASCHEAAEIHGDGTAYGHMYEVAGMPRCEDCHGDDVVVDTGAGCSDCHGDEGVEVPAASVQHAHHVAESSECAHCHRDKVPTEALPNLQCQACHSQPYKNCSNCHNHTLEHEGFDIDESTIQFKMARNPSPHREEYDIAVVRQVAVSPETYANWGMDLRDFESKPTWLYSSPHNISKNTEQTAPVAGESCSYSCHQSTSALLREADIGEPGTPIYNANIGIVIPDEWPEN